ncbi:chemotaxis protein CheW [Cyanobacterium sp. Dongsha4]|uniref:chemotaxis protein CheW n=1 Tax=Cyanobacterium sp. DS4 TaxID=2878255 RepID=UPI002E816115|nr:chemotaxis protein CheW [Cyanobacterium sp. Dongsha4]WVL00292.1 chemotaxis protein CheW [Cyanobacterium sp. Dongsha4]
MDYFIVELTNQKKIAIPLEKIQEVITANYADICPIPGVKNSLLGLISQRGILLWLLDLSLLLQNVPSFSNRLSSSTILVTKLGKNNVGLIVKKLGEIKDFLQDNISQDNLEKSSSIPLLNEYLDSFIHNEKELLPILNLANIQTYLNTN